MENAAEASHHTGQNENSIWPALIAFATGLAAVGFFFLMKGVMLVAGLMLVSASALILGGFLYSDTRNWSSALSRLGRIPKDTLVGAFPSKIIFNAS